MSTTPVAAVCPLCNGKGGANRPLTQEELDFGPPTTDEFREGPWIDCQCRIRERIIERLSDDIVNSTPVPNYLNKLYQLNQDPSRRTLDRTCENLIIKGLWSDDICPHLKVPLWDKLLRGEGNWPFKIVTDFDLKNVHVGAEQAHKNASRVDLETTTTWDSVPEFLGDLELLIIRLGYCGAAGVSVTNGLVDALGHMASKSKPVWVIDRSDRPFKRGHPAWSEDAQSLLSEFTKIDLSDGSNSVPDEGMSMDGHRPQPRARQASRSEPEPSGNAPEPILETNDPLLFGKSKKHGRR